MFKIAVFDKDQNGRDFIKKIIVKYTVQQNTDVDVLWFTKNISKKSISEYSSSFDIALISLDNCDGQTIGKIIYKSNEACRIVYYSKDDKEIENLLSVRPRGFFVADKHDFSSYFEDIISEIKESKQFFYHETRKDIFVIPENSILYFQSDLKYILINMNNMNVERIYAKLIDIENKLSDSFLRIHKSYIVNKNFVEKINKSEKIIILKNGQDLPISEVNYKTVLNAFSGG